MTLLGKLTIATAVITTVASPAAAQRYWIDAGVNLGGSLYSTLQGENEHGATGEDVRFGAGWLTGSQLALWPTSRFGLRGDLTFSDRPVSSDRGTAVENVNLWTLTTDLLVRIRTPNETWQGREILPYIALGAGWKWHDPAGDTWTCYDPAQNLVWSCMPYNVPVGDPNGAVFTVAELSVPAAHVGVGADVRFSPRWTLRLELSDRVYRPDVHSARFFGGNIWTLPDGDTKVARLVHEIGLQAGLQILLVMPRQQQAILAQQEQPPPVQQAPPRQQVLGQQQQQGAPPPREDDIAVCVVDPTLATGLRMQDAKFLVGTGDTIVERNGQRILLEDAVGELPVALNSDWYLRGTPFLLTAGEYRAEFLAYGEAVSRRPDEVAYLGSVDGVAIYADSEDVDAFRQMIDAARAAGEGDLAAMVLADTELRDRFDNLTTVYAPFRTIGCSFQPLARQEPVRKGGLAPR